ncbi:MAG: hypothetical protein AAF213_04375 [Pseudomonadota bacterium]
MSVSARLKTVAVTAIATLGLYAHDAATVLAAEPEAESKGGLPQFNPENFSSQVFWLLLVFFLLFQYLRKRVLPRYTEVLEERSEKITGDLSTAEEVRAEAEAAEAAYEASLSEARAAAHDAIAKAQEKANADTAAKLAKVESTIKGRLTKAENKINEQQTEVFGELSAIVSDAVQDSVERIAQMKPNKATVTKAVDQAMEGLS